MNTLTVQDFVAALRERHVDGLVDGYAEILESQSPEGMKDADFRALARYWQSCDAPARALLRRLMRLASQNTLASVLAVLDNTDSDFDTHFSLVATSPAGESATLNVDLLETFWEQEEVAGQVNTTEPALPSPQRASSEPPFNVQRIDHVVLRVTDLDRSIAFYGALLGCDVVKRRDDLGLVHLRAGASMIDLVSVQGPLGRKGGPAPGAEGRNMDHLCLRVHPFDATSILAFLEAAGVVHTPAVQDNFGAEGTGPSLYFTDPDGNEIELKGPAHP